LIQNFINLWHMNQIFNIYLTGYAFWGFPIGNSIFYGLDELNHLWSFYNYLNHMMAHSSIVFFFPKFISFLYLQNSRKIIGTIFNFHFFYYKSKRVSTQVVISFFIEFFNFKCSKNVKICPLLSLLSYLPALMSST